MGERDVRSSGQGANERPDAQQAHDETTSNIAKLVFLLIEIKLCKALQEIVHEQDI